MSEPRKSRLPLPLGALLEEDAVQGREARLWASIRARRSAGLGGHSEPPKAGQYLPAPLASVLIDGDDLVTERSRLFRAIRARRAVPRRSTAWRPAFAFGAFASVAFAVALLVVGDMRGARQPASGAVASALVEASGAPMRAHEAKGARKIVRLADESEIRLEPGARVEPLASSGSRFELLLTRGRAEFSVTPGGPRRWIIEAGLARVEVVGTVFVVDRTNDRVRVSVSRGIVLVRGLGVPGLVQRLTAAQSVEVRAPVPQVEPLPTVAPRGTPTVSLDEAVEISLPTRSERPRARRVAKAHAIAPWKAAVQGGDFAGAYASLGTDGFAAEVSRAKDVDSLLSLADVARLSGHPGDAVTPLERVLDEHADSSQAALAAFTLGRVQLDQLGSASKAAAAFEEAIALHPPHALLADCHARLVEAYARAGQLEAARRAASRYRTLFPAGRHLPDLDRWTKSE